MAASTRILIVDDDLRVVAMLHEALSPFYDVSTAQTGAAALALITQTPPDVVLLDYVLPDKSGLDLLREIKEAWPSVLVILITAFGSEDLSVESFRAGARDYLNKPFGLPQLLARIERLLATRRTTNEFRLPILTDPRPPRPVQESGPRARGLQRALAFIEDRLDTQLTLGGVAREAGMSQSHFCRAFKDFTGVTFREHLARLRVARAADLLRNKQLSIKDVCFEVGLNDPTYFARLFRKLTGNSPSSFRDAR